MAQRHIEVQLFLFFKAPLKPPWEMSRGVAITSTGLLGAAAVHEHCLGFWSGGIHVLLCSHAGKASYTNRVCIMAKVEDEIVPAYALWQVKAS